MAGNTKTEREGSKPEICINVWCDNPARPGHRDCQECAAQIGERLKRQRSLGPDARLDRLYL